jgi:hypothetical protein
MTWNRRQLLQLGGAALAAASLPSLAESDSPKRDVIKPKRLKKGDLVGLINPAGATFNISIGEVTWPVGTRTAPPTSTLSSPTPRSERCWRCGAAGDAAVCCRYWTTS